MKKNRPPKAQEAYSPAEVSEILGISRGTVYKMIRDKKVHSFEVGIGHRLKVPKSEVDRMMKTEEPRTE